MRGNKWKLLWYDKDEHKSLWLISSFCPKSFPITFMAGKIAFILQDLLIPNIHINM